MAIEINQSELPLVVVVGGGFGGTSLVHKLQSAPARIALVDRTNHQVFQPLLYQVATSSLTPSDIATPLREKFRNQKNTMVFLGEVNAIDPVKKMITVSGEQIPEPYDYLVLATGVRHSYFGHDEFAPFAPGLKTLEDAEILKDKILMAFETCECQLEPTAHPELLTFVLVGGGPTGVELAGAISELARQSLATQFRRFDPTSLKVIILDGGDRLISSFPPELSDKAKKHLEKLGVHVRLRTRVTKVDDEGVWIGGELIRSKNVFWTAGVRPNPIVEQLGAPTDKGGRILVNPDYSVPGLPELYVIGDAASYPDGKGGILPGVAQVAMQQGAYVGRLIESKITRTPPPKPFVYFNKGNLAVIGRFYSVVDSMGVRSAGFFAFLIWALIHIQFLPSSENRVGTFLKWLWWLVTGKRAGQTIVNASRNVMKRLS